MKGIIFAALFSRYNYKTAKRVPNVTIVLYACQGATFVLLLTLYCLLNTLETFDTELHVLATKPWKIKKTIEKPLFSLRFSRNLKRVTKFQTQIKWIDFHYVTTPDLYCYNTSSTPITVRHKNVQFLEAFKEVLFNVVIEFRIRLCAG